MDLSNLKPPISIVPNVKRKGVALTRAKVNSLTLIVWFIITTNANYKLLINYLKFSRFEVVISFINLIPIILLFNFIQALIVLLNPSTTQSSTTTAFNNNPNTPVKMNKMISPKSKSNLPFLQTDLPLTPNQKDSQISTPVKATSSTSNKKSILTPFNTPQNANSNVGLSPQRVHLSRHPQKTKDVTPKELETILKELQ